jgi:hypothetical protein
MGIVERMACDPDPAVWIGAQPEYSPAYADVEWSVY